MNQRQSSVSDVPAPNLVDMGRDAAHAQQCWATPYLDETAGEEVTVKVCGVAVAMLSEHSWAPHSSTDHVVNVGTIPTAPVPARCQRAGGKVCRRLMRSGWGGGLVVVRARESRVHGEGGQQVRSVGTGTPGGRL